MQSACIHELMFHTVIFIIIVYPMSMIMPMLPIPSISLVTRPFSAALNVAIYIIDHQHVQGASGDSGP